MDTNTILIGINHKTSPIEIREKFYLRSTERELLLCELKNDPRVLEALILSTCNRTEIYAHMLGKDSGPYEFLLQVLFKAKNLDATSDYGNYFYRYSDAEAIEHLLRVSAGLDSLVLGEKQILGQLKEAVELSRKKGMMGKVFNILSNVAIRTGKKAQSDTPIGFGGVSVSWAAVTRAQEEVGTLREKSVLVIGAGKMSKLAANNLSNKEIGQIYVMNRTEEKAVSLAQQFNGIPLSFWELPEILKIVDVCICSASAPHYLIEEELIRKVMRERHGRKLVFIDISIPRNINPKVSHVANTTLITIDDLDKVVGENIKKRQGAIGQVEEIVSLKLSEFYEKLSRNLKSESANEKVEIGFT